MRYLSWDEVKDLESFLVEDNDEAIGIEIHTGLYDPRAEDPYGKPETVKSYTLEELSGGEFIRLGSHTLRAVVSNRLYYTDSRNWVNHSGTDVAYIGARRGNGYEYERAVLSFSCPVVPLPDEEVLALDKFLVRDNKRVRSVRIMPGYMGLGGTNTSGFSADSDRIREYTPEQLSGGSFLWIHGISVRALVNDVLHFCRTNKAGESRVFTLDFRERDCIFHGEGIAYDTISATEVVLLLN